MRGEDGLCMYAGKLGLETPPRAWGRPEDAVLQLTYDRNTPTCVGKTGP